MTPRHDAHPIAQDIKEDISEDPGVQRDWAPALLTLFAVGVWALLIAVYIAGMADQAAWMALAR